MGGISARFQAAGRTYHTVADSGAANDLKRQKSKHYSTRATAKAALKLASEASAANLARQDLFCLVDAVKKGVEALDEDSVRYVDLLWREFKIRGQGILDGEYIEQYTESQNEVVNLRRQYVHNIMEKHEGCWFAGEDLDGITEKSLLRYLSANPQGDSNAVFVPFKRSEGETFLKYCRSPAKRKQYYVTRRRVFAENVPLVKEVITKRHENACVLGYTHHAAFKSETRMAKSVKGVESFLHRLEEQFMPQGRNEMLSS